MNLRLFTLNFLSLFLQNNFLHYSFVHLLLKFTFFIIIVLKGNFKFVVIYHHHSGFLCLDSIHHQVQNSFLLHLLFVILFLLLLIVIITTLLIIFLILLSFLILKLLPLIHQFWVKSPIAQFFTLNIIKLNALKILKHNNFILVLRLHCLPDPLVQIPLNHLNFNLNFLVAN